MVRLVRLNIFRRKKMTNSNNAQSVLEKTEANGINVKTEPLTLLDRCDTCSAAAWYRVVKNSLELTFCGHHGKKVESNLRSTGWNIDDQTDRLLEEENVVVSLDSDEDRKSSMANG